MNIRKFLNERTRDRVGGVLFELKSDIFNVIFRKIMVTFNVFYLKITCRERTRFIEKVLPSPSHKDKK